MSCSAQFPERVLGESFDVFLGGVIEVIFKDGNRTAIVLTFGQSMSDRRIYECTRFVASYNV